MKNFFQNNSFLQYFEIPWHFLVAPFFFLFLMSYLKIETKSIKLIKVVIPVFVFFIIIRLGFFIYENNHHEVVSIYFKQYVIIEEIISSIFSLLVFIFSYQKYNSFKKTIKLNNFDDLNWIKIFFKLGLLTYVFWFIPLIITLAFDFTVFMPSYYPLRVFTTILIYWLGYQSIVQLKVSEERKYLREYLLSKSKFADNSEVISPKEVNSTNRGINISEEIIDNVLKGLNEFENKKDYIQPNINLQVLAKKLDTNTNYLSKIINHYKGVSFTIYLNSLRIENIIKELKANPKIRKFTIKAIAQEAGFNNSDSFSKVFFKLKGENPSEFIKKLD